MRIYEVGSEGVMIDMDRVVAVGPINPIAENRGELIYRVYTDSNNHFTFADDPKTKTYFGYIPRSVFVALWKGESCPDAEIPVNVSLC